MDEHLKVLAEAGLALVAGEEALDAGEPLGAGDALDRAAEHLAVLRGRWPAMGPVERDVIGRAAAPLRARLDTARARLPQPSAVSVGAPEGDPEQELDPDPPV